jgi:NTE family protein
VFRAKRLADIATDQMRSLRVRAFVHALMDAQKGAYAQIGAEAPDRIRALAATNAAAASALLSERWLAGEQTRKAAAIPTTLRALSATEYELLEQHGFESASWSARLFPGWRVALSPSAAQ